MRTPIDKAVGRASKALSTFDRVAADLEAADAALTEQANLLGEAIEALGAEQTRARREASKARVAAARVRGFFQYQ